MMKRAAKALFAAVLAAFSFALPASAQFPANMPPNTVYGRSGISTGPGQAIPFSVIVQALSNQTNIWTQPQTFQGGTTAPLTDGSNSINAMNNTGKTALQIYCPFSVNGCNATTGGTEYDVGRFVLDLESAAGGTVSQANAVGAYAFCNFNSQAASYPGKGNCTSLSGFSIAAGQGANAWGITTFCADNSTPASYSGGNRSCINEFDIRIEDTTGTARGTGMLFQLFGSGTSASTLTAVDIENNAATLKWNFGVNCGNGAVQNACVIAGASSATAAANVASQAFAWQYFNGASVGKAMLMTAAGAGGFIFATTDTSITNAMDWSSVTINTCTLKIAFGCVIDGAGNASLVAAVGTGTFKSAGVISTADPGGTASTNTLTSVNSSTISSGTGTVKMSSANSANNTGWLKFFCGTAVCWVPAWVTNAP